MKKIFLILIMMSLMGIVAAADTRKLEHSLSYVITHVGEAKYQPVRSPEWQYDYGLPGGGLLNTYEYLHSLISFADLQRQLPMAIFVEGPHSDTKLNLTDKNSFGHYNPEFVKYFHTAVQRLLSQSSFINSTQSMMKDYGLLGQLQGLQQIYNYIENHPEEFEQYKQNYKKHLAAGDWPEGGYREFMPEGLNQDKYWNWSETDYYFWIRRDLDGTKGLWIQVVDDIVNAYADGYN